MLSAFHFHYLARDPGLETPQKRLGSLGWAEAILTSVNIMPSESAFVPVDNSQAQPLNSGLASWLVRRIFNLWVAVLQI